MEQKEALEELRQLIEEKTQTISDMETQLEIESERVIFSLIILPFSLKLYCISNSCYI